MNNKRKGNKYFRFFFRFVIFLNLIGAGVTLYNYPELKKEPTQLLRAFQRAMRCGIAGS